MKMKNQELTKWYKELFERVCDKYAFQPNTKYNREKIATEFRNKSSCLPVSDDTTDDEINSGKVSIICDQGRFTYHPLAGK